MLLKEFHSHLSNIETLNESWSPTQLRVIPSTFWSAVFITCFFSQRLYWAKSPVKWTISSRKMMGLIKTETALGEIKIKENRAELHTSFWKSCPSIWKLRSSFAAKNGNRENKQPWQTVVYFSRWFRDLIRSNTNQFRDPVSLWNIPPFNFSTQEFLHLIWLHFGWMSARV